MSGHSKWANIKVRKQAQDKKRAQVFTKLIRAISLAAREGGPNAESNPKLRLAVERARAFNVPKNNIERAIRREGSETVGSFTIDAIGPGGVTMLIEGATDNKNRTVSEIRRILTTHGGKIAEGGGARWAFARRGIIALEHGVEGWGDEAMTLAAIEAGAEDVREEEGSLEVVVAPDMLDDVRQRLAASGLPIADAAMGWTPTQTIAVSPEMRREVGALAEEIDDHPDVQAVWSNEESNE